MSFNLLESVQGYLSDELVKKAGSFLGESNDGVSKALSGIVPLVIGKFTEEASKKDGAQQLLDIATSDEATGVLGNLGNFFGEDNKVLLSQGSELVSGLFGDKANGMVEQISSFAGVKTDSVASLLSMVAPTVLGAIGKGAKDNNIDAGGLTNMIDAQSSSLLGFIPDALKGLIGILGLGKLSSLLSNAAGSIGEGVSTTAGIVTDGAGKVVDGAADLAGDAVDAGKAVVGKTGEVVGNAAGAVVDGAGKVVDGAADLAGDAVDAGKAVVGKTGEVVGNAAGAVVDGAGKVVDGAANLAGDAVDAGKAVVGKTGEVVGDAAGAVVDGAGKVVDGAADLAGDAVDAGKAVVGKTGEVVENVADAVVDGAEVAVEKTTSFIKWLLPLVLVIGAVFLLWKCLAEPTKNTVNAVSEGVEKVAEGTVDAGKAVVETTGEVAGTVANAITGTLDAAGNFIYDLGKETEIKLSNGQLLKVGDHSTEAKLMEALGDADAVDTDNTKGWITCDRLYFEHGNSNLTKSSDAQLSNLSEILKIYPTAKVKIGGYTDNTGSVEANKAISQQRAEAAKAKLIALGVNEDQLSAEGYGPEHPVCAANDTDECKSQNRRIDLRITSK